MSRPIFRSLLSLALLLGVTAQAQGSTTPTTQLTTAQRAAQAAAEARDLAARARSAYPPGSASIDQDLWKQAAAAAEAAVTAAPGNPEYLRLRAQIYTEVGFWHLAEQSWAAYFRATPSERGSETQQAAQVQYNLGYSAYTLNQPSRAAAFFAKCLNLTPQSLPCTSWAARIALEAGNYTQARQLYDRAVILDPQDKTLSYFNRLAQNAGRYGPAATRSFSRAYGELDAGHKPEALLKFQEAGRSAPNFVDAWREAGRLALELGDARAALEAYTALNALPHPSAADAFNLTLAREGAQYGLSSVQTFRQGYALYTTGNKSGAEQAFLNAANLNPEYAKAWAWLGRTRYERHDYPGAAQAYTRAVALDPNDKSSAYYLRLAQQGK